MHHGHDRDDVALLRTCPPDRFDIRVITIPAGSTMTGVAADWAGAIVVVDRGEVEVEGVHGGRCWFTSGDVTTLADLPLGAVRSVGPDPARLIVVSRQPGTVAPTPSETT